MPFDYFYSIYPRRINRKQAELKYNMAIKKGATHEQLANGAYEYQQWCERNGTEKQYIAHPATWINQHRWENDYRGDDNSFNTKAKGNVTNGGQISNAMASAVKIVQKEVASISMDSGGWEDNLPF